MKRLLSQQSVSSSAKVSPFLSTIIVPFKPEQLEVADARKKAKDQKWKQTKAQPATSAPIGERNLF